MNGKELSVLLIGERPGTFSGIIRRLERYGCRCRLADSYAEAHRLVVAEAFELVLSVIPPRDRAMSSLTEALAGSRASVFYVHRVEDSCWWLPALRDGSPCLGAPALRPGDFMSMLDRVVEEARNRRALRPEVPASEPIPPHEGPTETSNEPAYTPPVRAA